MNIEFNPMNIAIDEAVIGVRNKHGGPFGAIIVKDQKIIGRGHNNVILKNDPTAHAEMEAIRDACTNINSFNLSGTTLYTTCYPCPMCLGAILWARIEKVYYGLNSEDVAKIGFDDSMFYQKINNIDCIDMLEKAEGTREACLELLELYRQSDYIKY